MTDEIDSTAVDDLDPRRLWVRAWLEVAGAGIAGTTDKKVPAPWADQLLADYRERWPEG